MVQLPDDEPFATYYEHMWDGRSFVCLGDDCPLCEIGNEPSFRILMEEPATPR